MDTNLLSLAQQREILEVLELWENAQKTPAGAMIRIQNIVNRKGQ